MKPIKTPQLLARVNSRINNKHKIIIVSFLLVLFIGVPAFLILPTIQEIKIINQQMYDQAVNFEKKYLEGRSLKRVIQEYQQIKPTLPELWKSFVQEGEELDLVTALENIAADTKIEQQISFAQQNEQFLDPIEKRGIDLTLEGEYIDILNYLSKTEELSYYLDINSFSLQKISTDTKKESALKMKIKGYIFINKLELDP